MPNSKTLKNICKTIGSCLQFCFCRGGSTSAAHRNGGEREFPGRISDGRPGLRRVPKVWESCVLQSRGSGLEDPDDDDILGEFVEKLPDDIVIDILSRIGAKDAFMCRRVCKKWRDLTSTQGFVMLHMRRSIPMILCLIEHPHFRYSHALLENWMEPAATGSRPILHTIHCRNAYSSFRSSHGGLIEMKGGHGKFMILNPVNNEKVNITVATGPSKNEAIVSVFFHPSLEEFCTLWETSVWNRSGAPERVIYRLLNLGSNSKPCWREIGNRWCYMRRYKSSISVNEYIYWIVESESSCGIMAFSITSEEITLMPLPVAGLIIRHVKLLNVDGVLSLVLISSSKTRLVNVAIWTLENHSDWLWKSANYSFMGEVSWWDDYSDLKLVPIAICDGQLLINSGGILIVCNLKLGTTRQLWTRDPIPYGREHLPHVMTLISLKKCKPNICMDENGEIQGNA